MEHKVTLTVELMVEAPSANDKEEVEGESNIGHRGRHRRGARQRRSN